MDEDENSIEKYLTGKLINKSFNNIIPDLTRYVKIMQKNKELFFHI
jgi:hypothetical protein